MSKRLIGVLGAALLLCSLAVVSFGQTATKVQAVQNSDGTYTIVEYPVGKETIVTLNPIGLSGAKGQAAILRAADGTTIKVTLSGLPTEATAVNLYAVDPSGAISMLGPVEIANGAGVFTTSIPMSKFMLVASPDPNLSAYSDSTQVYFRSAVPSGMTVIPLTNAVGETVGAVTAPVTAVTNAATVADASDYTVPMLGIATFKKGDDTKLKINFSGAMEGARANVFIEPQTENVKTIGTGSRFWPAHS